MDQRRERLHEAFPEKFTADKRTATLIYSSSGRVIVESEGRSIRPAIEAILIIRECANLIVYDKTLGLAAAKLHSLVDPKAIYSERMTREARDFLTLNGIEHHYKDLVETLITEEKKTCPFEILAREHDAEELYDLLLEKYALANPILR